MRCSRKTLLQLPIFVVFAFAQISFLFHIAKYGSCGLQDINHLDIDQVSQDIDTGFKGPISTSTFQGLILILRNK